MNNIEVPTIKFNIMERAYDEAMKDNKKLRKENADLKQIIEDQRHDIKQLMKEWELF